jgi:HNH endonuclease
MKLFPELPSDERWIPGYAMEYSAMACGRIFSYRKGERVELFGVIQKGYRHVELSGKKKLWHRLIAITWLSNPEGKLQVNHRDSDKANNHVDNLEWCSASENIKHAYGAGKIDRRGSGNGRSKLTIDQAREIKASELGSAELALKYGVTKNHIYYIKTNRSWGHI